MIQNGWINSMEKGKTKDTGEKRLASANNFYESFCTLTNPSPNATMRVEKKATLYVNTALEDGPP